MNGADTIFSVKSPVDQLEAENNHEEPKPLNSESYGQIAARMLKKLSPLLQAREEADKVYSNGYFQRHYPGAEKKIKHLLHDRVMSAWANSLNDDDTESPKAGLGSGVTIHITVGK